MMCIWGDTYIGGKKWKERGLINSKGKGSIHEELIRQIWEKLLLPEGIAVVCIKRTSTRKLPSSMGKQDYR